MHVHNYNLRVMEEVSLAFSTYSIDPVCLNILVLACEICVPHKRMCRYFEAKGKKVSTKTIQGGGRSAQIVTAMRRRASNLRIIRKG